jgi:uncharacterized protein YceH (UPF0502 family)
MNIPDYYTDIAQTNKEHSIQNTEQGTEALSPLFSRIERYVAALYISTDHIEDTVSLKHVLRTLAGEVFLAFREATPEKKERACIQILSQVQSITRILVVGGYLSEQNATVLLHAADILKKESTQFFKKEIVLKKTPTEIHAFLSTHTDTEIKHSLNIKSIKEKSLEKQEVVQESVALIKDTKDFEFPEIQKNLEKKEIVLTPSPVRIQKSQYALQQHVPTGFSQSILDLKKDTKEMKEIKEQVKEVKEVREVKQKKESSKALEKPFALKIPKKEGSRRERISSVLSEKKDTTIKDIVSSFPDISEKTLQRELNDMVESGLLRRLGERRWSRYELVRFGV